ncbi:MAG: class I SAM-dependent methyltransferase [Hyphomonadaceae bacterium]|nr:class I SAM-dependent methyltransferase [Hyphomonadaceae bacterium]
MTDGTISSFRQKRGAILARYIASLSQHLGRQISIIDVGGRRDYWNNVGLANIDRITLINIEVSDLGRATAFEDRFTDLIGDARCLPNFADKSFDLYHSNSVIEHVGGWSDMQAMASEALRIGQSGWVQTPAWGFPIEPHFRLPAIHWFATPLRASMLRFARHYRSQDHAQRRVHAPLASCSSPTTPPM